MATTEVKVLDEQGMDKGYLKAKQNWWFDPAFPHAFELFDLDAFYETSYYAADHVNHETVCAYVDAVLEYGERLLGRPVESVLECGCAGGWFTQQFMNLGVDVFAVEGSSAGLSRALSRGIAAERLHKHDLRRPLQLDRRFDVAICTEVAEHVECPFSSQLIQNLVTHSDVVWFSFEPPDTNEAHYHHSNEQPAKFWINLFRFYDYSAIELPAEVGRMVGDRGTHIFCAANISVPSDLHVISNGRPRAAASFGDRSRTAGPKHDLKYWLRQLSPPIGLAIARAARANLRKRGLI
jgi:SAM-dependent methyltransferase